MWLYVLCISALTVTVKSRDAAEVLAYRNQLLTAEQDMVLGHEIVLSDNEEKANEIIMRLKHEVIDIGFKDPGLFNLSKHFFDYKETVKTTDLYKIIKAMPKGAALHGHDTALLGPDYVLKLTYLPDLYVCFQEYSPLFLFAKDLPKTPCETQWQLMKEVRYSSGNVKKFDAQLKEHFSIVIDNPSEVYSDINVVWSIFQQYFITCGSIFSYKPVWEQYFYDTLKAFREDNVMYIEVRSILPQLYDLDGTVYNTIDTAKSYKAVIDRFKKDYPDFLGAKFIYAPLKLVDGKAVAEYIKSAKEMKKLLPDVFAGFDLVGQEDLGRPLKEFLNELVAAENDLDFYFHAGETNWSGTSSDENLFDVIALNTKRIGHAFALIKHPLLLEEVKKRNIAIEVNVVSNAVLKLVEDVRNHPLAAYLAMDMPVVLSSDDPGVWEAEPLSHDFYVAFVGVASRHADLKVLKKLAINSIVYSAINDKSSALFDFEVRWTKFIDNIVKGNW